MTQKLLPGATGVLALADGTIFQGIGCGAVGSALGEVVFNTAMTGYQEILTDPSYMSQILAFTFPHVGNVGVNVEDIEQMGDGSGTSARGAIFRDAPTDPANWRSGGDLDGWMKRRGVVGLAGVDTRALTQRIRDAGAPHAVIAHDPNGAFDLDALVAQARAWTGLVGLDLAKDASTLQSFDWSEGVWDWPQGYPRVDAADKSVVVIDYGVKRNILRAIASTGAQVTVVPATTSAEDILARNPDGVILSNGPGDPAATGAYAVPEIRKLVDSGKPIMGICLGHQMLALALGAKTVKMDQGHHGANHPVKDLTTGKVEIVSMNHGFAVDRDSLPEAVMETHVSLFDGTNCGIALKDRPVFSVQHHPEASPGPTDSLYLFNRFSDFMRA
ncbi:glutamine-hydrolyzing carbamoyl-phosphate synthase small subunit [Brevundimonas sp. S30B]|uniref:glutamine-hydrolyzing carbamoyl-phosphate synthase small subunit n=1 Tax=unclassified Brevundimonas TaxID=2622653 RepID=UPI0010717CF5|nr:MULTISPECIES: glutamine-hydrolyzing carbamoyl-phosphate synthase small subunit [unclassified Brevundimonas]QBX37001.1 glutamine-hydrolyzing carbamoyl-phosphate synthase small subunit [Brevundimonas sp. MF30-B]TFW04203.1 glutamine-hydrolyzing carbamoyl-phosphate synthase small subunit [Brevundimonas sp. S30B]